MKLNFRSLEERIVFDGSFSELNNDFSFRIPEQEIPVVQPIIIPIEMEDQANNLTQGVQPPPQENQNEMQGEANNLIQGVQPPPQENQNDPTPIILNPDYHENFYIRDLNNRQLSNLLVEGVQEIPDHPLHLNSRELQPNVDFIDQPDLDPSPFYAVYPNYEQSIPVIIEDSFFSYDLQNMQMIIKITDMILQQSSEFVMSEIQRTRAQMVQIFMNTESIFRYAQELRNQNRTRIHYQIELENSEEDQIPLCLLIFDLSVIGIETNQAI